jgi:hypothetical protein
MIPRPEDIIWARICKRLWSPGIDSEESISPTYVSWRVGTKNRVVVPSRQAGNRFLVSLKGLQIRAQSRARICNRLRSPGIDSKESIPPAYVDWRTWARICKPFKKLRKIPSLAESIHWNRFLGSWNVYKFGRCATTLFVVPARQAS